MTQPLAPTDPAPTAADGLCHYVDAIDNPNITLCGKDVSDVGWAAGDAEVDCPACAVIDQAEAVLNEEQP